MGAVIVLLLLGTQILDWQWLLILPLATAAVGAWRTLRRLPTPYAVSQLLDRRLGLVDTLSTAFHFAGAPRGTSAEVRAWQRAQAERLCGQVRLSEAVPFTMPRAVYTLAVLGVAASSLFALRYGLDRRLDLQKPLARILQQAFGLEQQQLAALDRKQSPQRKRPGLKDVQGISLNEGQLQGGEMQDAAQALDANSPEESAENRKDPLRGAKQLSAKGEGDGEEGEDAGEESGENGDAGEGKPDEKGKPGGKQSSEGSDGGNSSLMAKFREAMQNMLSRMKQPPTGGTGGQRMADGKNSRQGKQQEGKSQNGQQGKQQAGGQQSEGQDGQEAQSQAAENAAGKGNGQGGEESDSKQPGSGIGRQDGDKDVRAAEQLAAMGKISEIIGKRSANVSGEVTVEVQSNQNQQLATPYSNRQASHGETTAEISRDEVPVALQAYVQQYFEQVRRMNPEAGPRDRTDGGKRP